jgi:hypothetical protein
LDVSATQRRKWRDTTRVLDTRSESPERPPTTGEPAPGTSSAGGVLALQRAMGNHVVARMLAGGPAVSRANGRVLQRLKKGDFKELDSFGLDRGTWVEFADALRVLDEDSLRQALALLDSRTDASPDTARAKALVKKQIHKWEAELTGENAEGEPSFGEDEEGRPLLRIVDVGETTVITSASDLLVWLVSHPAGRANTPKSFASSPTLTRVLDLLAEIEGQVEPVDVWDAVNHVAEDQPDADREQDWPAGQWGKKGMKQLGSQEWEAENEAPTNFRRKLPAEAYARQLELLRARLAGHKLVGVHATTIENLGPLMVEGVAEDKVDTGHHVGKGRGFYIIPAPRGVFDVTALEESAKAWEPFVVAVYLPEECFMYSAGPLDNVDKLEAENVAKDPNYYRFANDEAVIPPSLFSRIILVRDPSDITMADPSLLAEPTDQSAVAFTSKLGTRSAALV